MKAALVYSGYCEDFDDYYSGNSADLVKFTDSISADNQDTLVQLKEIAALLKEKNITVESIPFSESVAAVEQALRKCKPDFVFNLVETIQGNDSLIYLAAALYEYLGLAYSGCSAQALAILGEKIRQKELLKLAGLPTADFLAYSEPSSLSNAVVNGRWIVKSNTEHASVGISADSVVDSVSVALRKIEQMKNKRGGEWFAEQYVEGREFNISVLENEWGEPEVLPAAEIVFKNFPPGLPKIIDYAAKWDEASEAYHATQRSFDFPVGDQALLTKLKTLCCRCWHLFHLSGAIRVDFRVDVDGNPWILEINANPCLSSDAGFMAAAARAGLSSDAVIQRLIPRQCITNQSCNQFPGFFSGRSSIRV